MKSGEKMNTSSTGKTKVLFALLMAAVFIFTITGNSWSSVYAQDIPTDSSASEVYTPETSFIEVVSPYFSIEHRSLSDGTQISGYIINGPPEPPAEYEAERAASILPLPSRGIIAGFPSYSWVFGCSAVSGAMIAAYYDNNGYDNMYAGPTNGGVMPLTDTSWATWYDGFATYPNNPLIASHNGVDGRTTKGSIDDYWVQYGSSANDPYIGNWTEHTWSDAIGDYMKTSQTAYSNTDGSTQFWNYDTSGDQLTCSTMVTNNIDHLDGTYGRKLFYEARGYTVTDCYNQNTDNNPNISSGGFSLADFQAEIDAGHPVLLNLQGHSIVGYGYVGSTIYIRDTWDNNPANTYTMTWGTSYSGMELLSVSVVNLSGPYRSYLPMIIGGGPPSQVLWSQAISSVDADVYASQDFETAYDIFDIYIADDFLVPAGGWTLKEIFVPGDLWSGGTTLLNAHHLVFEIYTDTPGMPSGYPGGGGALHSISLLPTDAQIALSVGFGGFLSDVTLTLSTPINLGPGVYWLVFYPELDYTSDGQYGRHVSDTTNGYVAMVINPDGGFGFPPVWTSVQDGSTWGMSTQDMAFELRGNP